MFFELAAFKGIVETFKKNGVTYSCAIAPKENTGEGITFEVVMPQPSQEEYVRFCISPCGDGHWKPDNTKLVDPWLADVIGFFIVNNF